MTHAGRQSSVGWEETWTGQASPRPEGPAAGWKLPLLALGLHVADGAPALPPRIGFRGLEPAGGPDGGSQNLYSVLKAQNAAWQGHAWIWRPVCLPRAYAFVQGGNQSLRRGGTPLSCCAQPHKSGREPRPPGHPQEDTALALRFSPLCLKLRSGF